MTIGGARGDIGMGGHFEGFGGCEVCKGGLFFRPPKARRDFISNRQQLVSVCKVESRLTSHCCIHAV